MSELRTNQKTLERIAEVVQMKEPWNAVCGVVDLIENHYQYEEKIPTEFNSQTGKPIKFNWKPYKRFKGEVVLNWDHEKDRYSPLKHEHHEDELSLSQKVVDFLFENGIKEQGIFVETHHGNYALNYSEDSYEASAHNDRWTQTDRKIEFIPLNKQLTKDGIKGGSQ
jgi:hypothetical protein